MSNHVFIAMRCYSAYSLRTKMLLIVHFSNFFAVAPYCPTRRDWVSKGWKSSYLSSADNKDNRVSKVLSLKSYNKDSNSRTQFTDQ